ETAKTIHKTTINVLCISVMHANLAKKFVTLHHVIQLDKTTERAQKSRTGSFGWWTPRYRSFRGHQSVGGTRLRTFYSLRLQCRGNYRRFLCSRLFGKRHAPHCAGKRPLSGNQPAV